MSRPPKLTETQKRRLKILEPQLKQCVQQKDFENAKVVMADIQQILKPTGHVALLIQMKNWLFELALDIGDYNYAEHGFIGNRKLANKNTRIYLESTALLAICYLRKKQYELAKPLIEETLRNDKVIKSESQRKIFRQNIIERFDEEVSLFSLTSDNKISFDVAEIQEEAKKLVIYKSEEEIYILIGESLPASTKELLFQIDSFSKNLLPSAERLALPSPQNLVKDELSGKTIFSSVKRVIYNSICDPKSEVYQAWYTNGMSVVLDKKYITAAVVACLAGIGIGIKALVVSIVALIIRFGLNVYCEHYRPLGVMDSRK